MAKETQERKTERKRANWERGQKDMVGVGELRWGVKRVESTREGNGGLDGHN